MLQPLLVVLASLGLISNSISHNGRIRHLFKREEPLRTWTEDRALPVLSCAVNAEESLDNISTWDPRSLGRQLPDLTHGTE